jgi:putative ABC transport system permease protein
VVLGIALLYTAIALAITSVVALGAVLGVAVTGLNLAGIWAALGVLSVWSPPSVPWLPLAGAAAACAVIAVTAAVATAARHTRS